jgi:hypothetical protein
MINSTTLVDLKMSTAGASCVPTPPQRIQLSQVRPAWYLDLLLTLITHALISPLLLRCCCDLYPNVTVHAGPCQVRQSQPTNLHKHSGLVAGHKTDLTRDTLPRISAIMRHIAWEPQAGDPRSYGRNVSQQQRRVRDQQPHQDLGESSHQVSARNTEFLLLHNADGHGSDFSASTIIAPELLPVISSHLARNLHPYPTLHELPHPFHLHRFYRRPSFSGYSPPQIPRQPSYEIPTQAGLRDGVSVSQALQLAMRTGINGKCHVLSLRAPTPSTKPALDDRTVMLETKQPVIGNLLLSSCPGKKSESFGKLILLVTDVFPAQ